MNNKKSFKEFSVKWGDNEKQHAVRYTYASNGGSFLTDSDSKLSKNLGKGSVHYLPGENKSLVESLPGIIEEDYDGARASNGIQQHLVETYSKGQSNHQPTVESTDTIQMTTERSRSSECVPYQALQEKLL